jgi:IclR family transcriptional regulator, pca regulon regulatory protein
MIVDPKVIMSRIDQARIDGFAFTDEELELGMRSLAPPLRNAQGKVVAAMSISTFTARLTLQELRDQCLPVLQQNAALLGCKL